MFDFAALPPEVNSARIYTGPGAAPLQAAAASWDAIAMELEATAASFSSTMTALPWTGPSAIAAQFSAAHYVSWLTTTAAQAQGTAVQARMAAAAFSEAWAASVPPPVIYANRVLLGTLVATNLLGQNTAAIAETEAHYMMMWAQDVGAMTTYAASAASATPALPFTPPPIVAHPLASLLMQTLTPGGGSATPAQVGNLSGGLIGFLNGQGIGGIQGLGLLQSQYAASIISSAPTTNFTSVIALASLATLPSDLRDANKPPEPKTVTPRPLRPSAGKGMPLIRPPSAYLGTGERIGGLMAPSAWTRAAQPTITVQPASLASPLVEDGHIGMPVLPFMPVANRPEAKGKEVKTKDTDRVRGSELSWLPGHPSGG